jgi:phage terminase large subunit-like protein
VAAVTKRNTKGIISIETECGNKIQCTPEHPFITADGRQKRAGDFSSGETIVGLSNWRQVDTLPKLSGTQETNTENLHYVPQGDRGFCGPASVSDLPTTIFNSFKSFNTASLQKTSNNLLQSFLQWTEKSNTNKKTLSTLWQTLSTAEPLITVLFKKMRRLYACKKNARNWQCQLSTWLPNRYMEKIASCNPCKRLFNLRGLQHLGTKTVIKRRAAKDQSLCSPHRPQPLKQYPAKFNHVVQAVPCSTPPNNGQSWEAVTISRVDFLSEREEFVYDLEVSHSSHNFIANGLNVLNCLIDDCIKSATDIANPDIRKSMQDNWNAVISPTMFEGGRAICLGTRFRHDDIHATTFNEQNNWQQIVLSAIQQDPKTGDELSYWPEMWSLDYLKEKKRQAPVAFSFQYMNQIVRQGELSLAPELIVKAEISTEFDTLGIGVDLSAGIKEKNDYTVMILGGRIDDRIHIIDYRRMRVMGNLEKLDALKELLNDWSIIGKDDNGNFFPTYSTCDIWSEAVQYQASLEADFKRICLNDEGLHNLLWHPIKGFRADKLARFRGIIGMFEERKIIFNRFRNFTNLFEELTNFGVSGHDDCVDALVWLVNGLTKKGKLQFDY